MARSVDAAAHAVKREAFLDAAEKLMHSKGFEQVSVQDILNETGASKGAFYHYFTAKQDLLEALAERMAERVSGAMQEAAESPDGSAAERLSRMFAAIGASKLEQRDMIVAMMKVWFSDANAVVRLRLRRGVADRIAPLIDEVAEHGNRDGSFNAAQGIGRILAGLIQDHNDEVALRLLEADAGGAPADKLQDDARRLAAIYTGAIERVLGAPPGSVRFVDFDTLEAWLSPGDH